ncbi:Hypothetical protein A7982_08703 [Minicystis rosea]|nr:Hypothetical protein A7982_08703 [Minicystis rosea]
MIRRRFLSLVLASPMLSAPSRRARDPRCGLSDHLRALATRAASLRGRALDAITSIESLERRKAWARSTFWQLVSGSPARTPLALRTMGVLQRADHRVEKLVYESRPGLLVPALLYLPTGRSGPFPGVLFQSGHLQEGKAAPAYQRACLALVKHGIAVLAFDPVGQGERRLPTDPMVPDDTHDRLGLPLLLTGGSLTGMMLWDAIRSLDVLASHPDIDARRLASFGQSGGGTLTMFLAAADDRLAAAVLSSANTENVATLDFVPPGAVDDAEQNLPNAGPLGFDRWDTLYPLAPKPLLVLVSTEDPVTTYSPHYLSNGAEEWARLQRMYALLGCPSHLGWVESPAPHRLSPERRAEAERWLGRFLLGAPVTPHDEASLVPAPIEQTWVVPGGDVTRALGGRTPMDLIRARPITTSPPPVDLRAWMGATYPVPSARREDESLLEVRSAEEVWIPVKIQRPPKGSARAVVLVVDSAAEEDDWSALVEEGYAFCLSTMRGTGTLLPLRSGGASAHARAISIEDGYAWASLILGESLLAQRVTDLLAVVEALLGDPSFSGCPLALAARDASTVPALFAATIDGRIALLHLDGGLVSYRSVVDAEVPRCPLANIQPGILTVTDLPNLVASLAPRPVILTGPVDGAGHSLSLIEARALHGAAPHVVLSAERAFGARALSSHLGALSR